MSRLKLDQPTLRTDAELTRDYWDTYGHLDLEMGEKLDAKDVAGGGGFSDEELIRLKRMDLIE